MSSILDEERKNLENEFPYSGPDAERQITSLCTPEVLLPNGAWTGQLVIWAVQDDMFNNGSLNLERINNYLEDSNVNYRLGLYIFPTEAQRRQVGRHFYTCLQAYLEEGELDLINSGVANRNGDDILALKLLLEHQQAWKIEPKANFKKPYLCYNGNYYGLGNKPLAKSWGFFVQDEFAERFNIRPDSEFNWQWLSTHSAELNSWSEQFGKPSVQITMEPWFFVEEYTIPDDLFSRLIYLDAKGRAKPFWSAPSYREYEAGVSALRPNVVSYLEEDDAAPIRAVLEVELDVKNDGSCMDLSSGEKGLFFKIAPLQKSDNWYVCLENIIPVSSQKKDLALDFLYRLYEDPELVKIVFPDSEVANMTLADWYGKASLLGRLCNEELVDISSFYPAEASNLQSPIGLWEGFYVDAQSSQEMKDCADFLQSKEAKVWLKSIFEVDSDHEQAKAQLTEALQEIGLSRVISDVESATKIFLEINESTN
ncbi:MAG: hypothetical protein Q4E09_03250 [Eubacteriales bacterium]|nr:hypothetical protein [Eubacteriales bacterium]